MGADCFHLRQGSLDSYGSDDVQHIIQTAGLLVDNGRAGSLSRFDELIEFIRLQNYKTVGIAYCFSMENIVQKAASAIEEKTGAVVVPARCSMGGLREGDVDRCKSGGSVGCNPAGQALFLNDRADFVVEMGLCMGHDVLFHQKLKRPFTVLLVKDRLHNHDPLKGINAVS